jgi:hypothetical protein
LRLWTWKFALSVLVVVVFLADAFWLGPDPVTGHARHKVPYADSGIASFAFLLSLLYVFSHGWQCVMSRVRGQPPKPPEEPKRRKRRRR